MFSETLAHFSVIRRSPRSLTRMHSPLRKLDSTSGSAPPRSTSASTGKHWILLVPCVENLLTTKRREEAAKATTFLGQLYTTTGFNDEAEHVLQEAIALFADEPQAPAVRGYLRALLGRLYVVGEPRRLPEAREQLNAGREETIAKQTHSVRPLVESYWAELLLAENSPDGLREADAVLESAEAFGWARGEIILASLRARIALAENRVANAVDLSDRAVEALNQRGGAVPAVSSEEIFLVHARVLAAAGRHADASVYADRAADVVQRKAASLHNEAQRESFLKRARLSRDVLEAAQSMSHQTSSNE